MQWDGIQAVVGQGSEDSRGCYRWVRRLSGITGYSKYIPDGETANCAAHEELTIAHGSAVLEGVGVV